jgi:hypothetical protein
MVLYYAIALLNLSKSKSGSNIGIEFQYVTILISIAISIKQKRLRNYEALNHFVVFSLEHIDHICAEFTTFYHECQPHQGIGNRLIGAEEDEEPLAVTSLVQVRCEKRLGGLLKHYYHAA